MPGAADVVPLVEDDEVVNALALEGDTGTDATAPSTAEREDERDLAGLAPAGAARAAS